MTATLMAWALAFAVPPAPAADAAAAPAPVAAERKDDPQWQAARKQLTMVLALLTALAALVMLLGFAMGTRRWGRKIARRKERLPVKYFDLTVPPEEPPPHEPSAEERRRKPPNPPD